MACQLWQSAEPARAFAWTVPFSAAHAAKNAFHLKKYF
jgi:hypothetical protein